MRMDIKTLEEKKKVNSIPFSLLLVVIVIGLLISFAFFFIHWEDEDKAAVYIRLVNHILTYGFIIYYGAKGYRVKKFDIIRVISGVFSILSLIDSIYFYATDQLLLSRFILSLFSCIALFYFSIRANHKLEAYIALFTSLGLLFVYGVIGCIHLSKYDLISRAGFTFGCFGCFATMIVEIALGGIYVITRQPRNFILNPPKQEEIERVLD